MKEKSDRSRAGQYAGYCGIAINLLLFAVKFAAGVLSGSVAVTADAANNLSDAGSSVVTAVSFQMSRKPADAKHPFGHARVEYVAGLIVSLVITVIGFQLLADAVRAIVNPEKAVYGTLTFAALVFSVVMKIVLFIIYRVTARSIGSVSLEAAATDSLSDVLSTSVVIAGAIVGTLTGVALDGWLGAAVACLIIYSGIKLVFETSSPLLGDAPDAAFIEMLCDKLKSYDGVIGIHDLVIHSYGVAGSRVSARMQNQRCFATVHVEVPAERDILESHDIIDNIENDFLRDLGIHLVVHLDPVVTADERVAELRASVTEIISQIDPRLTLHDFRVVFGITHTNLIFDMSVPIDFPLSDAELSHNVCTRVRLLDPQYNTVITVDRNYMTSIHTD